MWEENGLAGLKRLVDVRVAVEGSGSLSEAAMWD